MAALDLDLFRLSDREFERIRARLYASSGISLSAAKRTLVVARLSRLLRKLGHDSFDAYLDHLDRSRSATDAQDFVNALTTNLTRFWREEHHFTHLVGYVGELIKARADQPGRRLRIWSAGCSTGQEPFTIALSLLEAFPELARWDCRILATDIDTAVLAKAATATFPAGELNGLAPARQRLFEPLERGAVRVPAEAAAMVAFKPLNLMASWPMKGPFDAIFCRNVTIYFDRETQDELFARLGQILVPGGYLYIGHSESLRPGSSGFRLVGKTIYQSHGDERPAVSKARNAA